MEVIASGAPGTRAAARAYQVARTHRRIGSAAAILPLPA
jgi:hypothetical protein